MPSVDGQTAEQEGGPASHANVQTAQKKPLPLDLEEIENEVYPVDPETARRVLRKIDLFLMPAMMIGMVSSHVSVPIRDAYG